MAEQRIKTGHRVVCHKQGPYDGRRGRVVQTLAGGTVAHVNFGASALTEHVSYFEAVT